MGDHQLIELLTNGVWSLVYGFLSLGIVRLGFILFSSKQS